MATKQTALTAESLMQAQQKMIESGKLTAEQLKTAQEQLAKLQELVGAYQQETAASKVADEKIEKAIVVQTAEVKKDNKETEAVREEIKNLTRTIEGKEPKPTRAPLPRMRARGDRAASITEQDVPAEGAAGSKEQIEKIGDALPAGGSGKAKSGLGNVISEKILADIEKSRSPAYEKFMDLFSGRSAAPEEAGVPGAAVKPSAGMPAAGGAAKAGADKAAGAAAKPAKATKGDAQVINLTAKSVNLKGPVNITVTAAQATEMMGSDSGGRRTMPTAVPAAAAAGAAAAAEEDGGFDISDFSRKGLKSTKRGLSSVGRMLRSGVSKLGRGVSSMGRGVMTAGRGIMSALGTGAIGSTALLGTGVAAGLTATYAGMAPHQEKLNKAAEAGDYQAAVSQSRMSSQIQMGAGGEFADPIQQQEAADKEAKDALKAQAAQGNKKAAKALADMEAGKPTEADIKTAKEAKVARKQEDLLKKGGTTRHWLTGSYKKAGTGFLGFGMEDASKADISAAEAAAEKSVTAEATSAAAGKPGEAAAAGKGSMFSGMSGIPVSDTAARAESKTQAVQVKKAADKIQAKRQAELADKVARGKQAEAVGRGPVMSSGAKVESASVDNAVIKSAPAAPIIIPAAAGGSNTVNNTTNNIMPRADVRPNESAMERYTNKQAHFV